MQRGRDLRRGPRFRHTRVTNRGIAFASSSDAMSEEQSLDFGAELAQAREQRGITLEEVARRTKIGLEALKAIERCDVTPLPGGLYTRGFLRAYAREVGCNPDDIIRRYREKFKDQDLKGSAIAQLDNGVSVSCAPGQVHVKDIDAMTRRRSQTAWITGSAVVLMGVAIHFVSSPTSFRIHRNTVSRAIPQADSSSTTASPPSVASSVGSRPDPVGTAGKPNDEPARPTDASRTLRLDVKPSGSCWLSATADGQRVIYRLMNAGERTQIEAHEEVILHVGDPATCEFDINGAGVRQLGVAGQPVTVRLTRENFQQFLVRPAVDQRD
jgi:cytoskeleton protein RodZ